LARAEPVGGSGSPIGGAVLQTVATWCRDRRVGALKPSATTSRADLARW
jgi:hypothetical protein